MGDLEMISDYGFKVSGITHRTGDLEKRFTSKNNKRIVTHRTGDLESVVVINYTPATVLLTM